MPCQVSRLKRTATTANRISDPIRVTVLMWYAHRSREIDRVFLFAFVLGSSTRKVSETLLAILGPD
jgi:hypothetical protein